MEANTSELVTLAEIQARKLGVAQACRVRQHGIEDGLQFSGRTTDYAKHLRGCRLLLQRLGKVLPRLGELTGARFELLFQLDR